MTLPLRIGIVDQVATNPANRFAETVRRFKGRDGRVVLHVTVQAPPVLERDVAAERLDLAIAPFFQHAADLDYEPLFEEPQGLYCGADHPVFGRRRTCR